MSDAQAPSHVEQEAPVDADLGWLESTSDKEENYRVKASDYDIKEASDGGDQANASGPRFDRVEVNWAVGTSGAPSSDVTNRTAITWYKLSKAAWYSPFQYELTFNTRDTYNYYFGDQTHDAYSVNVFQNAGTHIVQYRSAAPTITVISGN